MVEAQAALHFVGAVALVALVGEKRPDLGLEEAQGLAIVGGKGRGTQQGQAEEKRGSGHGVRGQRGGSRRVQRARLPLLGGGCTSWQLAKLPSPCQSVILGEILSPREAVKCWLVEMSHLVKKEVVTIVAADLFRCPHLNVSSVTLFPAVAPRRIVAANHHRRRSSSPIQLIRDRKWIKDDAPIPAASLYAAIPVPWGEASEYDGTKVSPVLPWQVIQHPANVFLGAGVVVVSGWVLGKKENLPVIGALGKTGPDVVVLRRPRTLLAGLSIPHPPSLRQANLLASACRRVHRILGGPIGRRHAQVSITEPCANPGASATSEPRRVGTSSRTRPRARPSRRHHSFDHSATVSSTRIWPPSGPMGLLWITAL